MAKKGRKKIASGAAATKGRNWADVAYQAIDSLYNLTNTGNLIGVLIFGAIVVVWIVISRLPPSDLANLMSGLGTYFFGERFYMGPLVLLLIFCSYLKIKMDRVYKSEIQRLTDFRKQLIHGFQTGHLAPLENHTTTDSELS